MTVHVEKRAGFPILRRLELNDLVCVPFAEEHISDRYLGWLNDPEVNRYSRRRFQSTTREDALQFFRSLSPTNQVAAMMLRETAEHIGNLQLGPIDPAESHAEVRILIGEKTQWGKGYARQAIAGACEYFFQALGLHRVEAMSCNPGFIRAVEQLGWREEGRLRERFPQDGARLDYRCFGILAWEFTPRATLIVD